MIFVVVLMLLASFASCPWVLLLCFIKKKNATVNLHGRSLEVLSFFHQLSLGAFALLQKIISTLHGLSFLPFCGAVLENVEQLGRCLPRLAQGGEG